MWKCVVLRGAAVIGRRLGLRVLVPAAFLDFSATKIGAQRRRALCVTLGFGGFGRGAEVRPVLILLTHGTGICDGATGKSIFWKPLRLDM
jgi:hypothetical protein